MTTLFAAITSYSTAIPQSRQHRQQEQQHHEHPAPGFSSHMTLAQLLPASMGNWNFHHANGGYLMEYASQGGVHLNPDDLYHPIPFDEYEAAAVLVAASATTTTTTTATIITAALEELASLDEDFFGYEAEYTHDEYVDPNEEAEEAVICEFPRETQQ